MQIARLLSRPLCPAMLYRLHGHRQFVDRFRQERTSVSASCKAALLQLLTKFCSSVQGLRFLLGITEAANYTTLSFVLASWYTPTEAAKRAAFYTCCGHLGSMTSGFIQNGINSSLDGVLGHSGWRWLFIIDAIMTLPTALWGIYALPDSPSKTKAHYLSQEEKEIARTRMPPRDVFEFSWGALKRVVTSWQWYTFMGVGCMQGILEVRLTSFAGVNEADASTDLHL